MVGILTWIALAAWLLLAGYWWFGMRRLPRLGASAGSRARGVARRPTKTAEPPGGWPRLSMIVAARDEVATIAPALRSWLEQDYPQLEIIVVDDRSVDGTGSLVRSVLAERAAPDGGPGAQGAGPDVGAAARVTTRAASCGPTVRVIRLDELPDGWLGKTHAQARGAAAAEADWLVFVDADVRLAPNALRLTMAAALRSGADHVALLPRFDAPGRSWQAHLVLAFETAFTLLLTLLLRPWLAPDPRSRATLGIGAFGLYRRSAYERAGGHDSVRLRPDDDLALASCVKAAGGRSLVALAPELAIVAWYPSLASAVHGLEKNAYAGLRYSLVRVLLVSLGLLATHVLPFAVLLVGGVWPGIIGLGAERAAAGVVLVVLAVYAWYGGRIGQPAWYALLHPFSVLALVFALLRSTLSALLRGRIDWRGTSYALSELQDAQREVPNKSP